MTRWSAAGLPAKTDCCDLGRAVRLCRTYRGYDESAVVARAKGRDTIWIACGTNAARRLERTLLRVGGHSHAETALAPGEVRFPDAAQLPGVTMAPVRGETYVALALLPLPSADGLRYGGTVWSKCVGCRPATHQSAPPPADRGDRTAYRLLRSDIIEGAP